MFKRMLAAHVCTQQEAADRYRICADCDNITMVGTCRLCGCFLRAKTKLRAAGCPLEKWVPIEFTHADVHESDDPSYHNDI